MKDKEQNQEYEFRLCKLEGIKRNFVSSIDSGGYYVCTECGFRESKKPFKMNIKPYGYEIKNKRKKR